MYQFLLKSYKRFLRYLRTPDDRSFSRVNLSFKLRTLLSLLLLNVVLAGIWLLGFKLIGIENLDNVNSELMKMPFGTLILIGVVLVPFVEELIFRLPLKYNRNYLLQFLIAIVALFAPAESKTSVYAAVRRFWKRFFWVFFYLMTSAFAFVHIYNYVDAQHLLLWSPLLTMVQFITGLIIGYIRVRFGFLWGWYYHAIYNLLLFSLSFASGEQPSNQKSIPPNKAVAKEESVYTENLKVRFSNFKAFRVDSPEFTLYVSRKPAAKDGFAGYYGITPNRIYFEQCTLQFMYSTLSTEKIKITDPSKYTYDVEFKMKKPTQNVTKVKALLLRELTKVFSMMKQP